jgi:hypothetical protein
MLIVVMVCMVGTGCTEKTAHDVMIRPAFSSHPVACLKEAQELAASTGIAQRANELGYYLLTACKRR